MNIDHGVSNSNLKSIFNAITSQFASVDYYIRETEGFDVSMFNQNTIDTAFKKFEETLNNAAHINGQKMLDCLDKIEEQEQKNATIFNMADPEFQSAINIINTMKSNLDAGTAGDIIKTFKGSYRALDTIRSMYQTLNISYDPKLDSYLGNIGIRIEEIRVMMNTIKFGGRNVPTLLKLHTRLCELADICGLDVDDANKSPLVSEKVRMSFFAERLGVSLSDLK